MLRRRVPPRNSPPPGADETAIMRGGPTPPRPAVATVSVPRVAGLAQADAVRQLRSFGFKTAIQEQASSRPPGTVVGQNPAAGAKVARGATVILAVSQKAAG